MTDKNKKIDELALYGAFWRNNNFAGNYNFERLMALGMTQVMIPIFRSLGYEGEKLREGYKRHLVFYNTHPYFGSLIMGVMAAMEETKANDDSITPAAINDVKVAMMGPFAGIGDSFFWGTIHTIIFAIAANLAIEGSFLGVIVSLLVGVVAVLGTYFPFFWGYRAGIGVVDQIRSSDLLDKFVLGAKIVGMTVAGVMVASLIQVSTPLVLFQTEAEGSGIVLQDILDSILPKALPLALLFGVYFLLKKKVNPLLVMLILIILTVLLTTLGWI